MSEPNLLHRLGNVILDVRHATYMSRQGEDGPRMDGWIGPEAHLHLRRDIGPMLLHPIAMHSPMDEFEFMGVKFKRDTSMPPRSIVICVGGAPVRRIALDFPEYDREPVVDHPTALSQEIMALRYFEKGDRLMDRPRPIVMMNRLPAEGDEPKTHSISLERLVELGLLFKEEMAGCTAVGLTLMGREALRQHDAAG